MLEKWTGWEWTGWLVVGTHVREQPSSKRFMFSNLGKSQVCTLVYGEFTVDFLIFFLLLNHFGM
jgi:hypothetical protein